MADEVHLIDTTIRDGQQSLWAMNMRTSHVAPVLPDLDRAGYDQIELMAPSAAFTKFVRHHRENPWDWVHSAVSAVRDTPLRWHGTFQGQSVSGPIAPEIGRMLLERLSELGIRFIRFGDNWNRFKEVLADQKRTLDECGIAPIIHLIYTVSPRHDDAYYVKKAREAAELRPFRLCLKDVGGLLTPERTRQLVPKLLDVTGDIPWEFHGHCTNGLGPLNLLEAVDAGIKYVHTAIPPLANGSSQPSVYTVTDNLIARGYDVDINVDALLPITEHLRGVARKEGLPEGRPYEYNEKLYRHQVPGGMISNLEYQLNMAGIGDRLDETLEETAQVREDFGYPIMVTPLSQIVGTQAALNVIVGDRYTEVTDQTIEYALGFHGGEEATSAMNQDIRSRILDRPQVDDIRRRAAAPVTLSSLRERHGDLDNEDLLLLAFVGNDALKLLAEDGDPHNQNTRSREDVIDLIRRLDQARQYRHISVSVPGFSLELRRHASDSDS